MNLKKFSALLLTVLMLLTVVTVPVFADGTVAKIGTNEYTSLAEAIAAVGANQTITLAQNTVSEGISVASGKNFTLDLSGNTLTFGPGGAGSPNTKTSGLQLLKGSTITIKNGKINLTEENKDSKWNSGSEKKGIAMIIQNYCYLTIDGVEIDAANIAHNGGTTARYAVSNNNAATTIKNSTINTASGDFAFDCYYADDKNYSAPTVNVENSTINGKVEAMGKGSTLNLKAGTTVNGQVRVGANQTNEPGEEYKGCIVNIENGATVNGVAAAFGASTLNVNGAVNGYILTNGNAVNKDAVVNIGEGAEVTAAGDGIDVSVYIPNGTLNVTGGKITGETAVYFKSTKLNITGGTLIGNGAAKAYDYSGNGANATGDALVIDSCNYPNGIEAVSVSGGTFESTKGAAVASFTKGDATPVTGFITGGTFKGAKAVDGGLIADDYAIDADGNVVDSFVAKIGAKNYGTLESAIAACKKGETIVLLDDVVVSERVDVVNGKDVILDLNGKTISVDKSTNYIGTTSLGTKAPVCVCNGGKLTINDSVGTGAIVSENATVYAAVIVTAPDDDAANGDAVLVINGGTFKGYYFGITGNGSRHGTDVTVNGGTITGFNGVDEGLGIFNPQKGNLTVNGGKITGYESGIEIRAGKLTVNGGEIVSTGKTFSVKSNRNGSTTVGAGIAVAQHTTDKPIDVYLNGGSAKGIKALSVADPEKINPDDVNVYLKGTAFEGEVYCSGDFEQKDGVISAKASAPDVIMNADDLLDAATNGGSYKLGADIEVDGNVVLAKSLKLDLNGFSITDINAVMNNGGLFDVKRGTKLTIDGEGKIIADNHYAAVRMTVTNEPVNGDTAALVVNGGELVGHYYAVCGNGQRHDTDIVINGGKLYGLNTDADGNHAMYIPQNGTVTVNGGELIGLYSAIEVRAGKLTINGGTFTATTKDAFAMESNGSGSTCKGVAIAVSQHSTKQPIDVVINDGTFKGSNSVAVVDTQPNKLENVTVALNGGNFNDGIVYKYEDSNAANVVKGVNAVVKAPEGYRWDVKGKLVPEEEGNVEVVSEDLEVKADGLTAVLEDVKAAADDKLVLDVEEVAEFETVAETALVERIETGKKADRIEITLERQDKDGNTQETVEDTKTNVVEVIVKFDSINKSNVSVFSYHGDEVLTYAMSKSGADGTFYIADGYLHIFTTKFSSYMVTYDEKTTTVYASLTLDKNIDINFKIKGLSADDASRFAMKADGEDVALSYENGVLTGFVGSFAPADIQKLVTVDILVDGTVAQTIEYSVFNYCYTVIRELDNQSYTEEHKALCEALLHYGSECEKLAGKTTDNADRFLAGASYSSVPAEYAAVSTADVEVTSELVLGSLSTIKLYVAAPEDATVTVHYGEEYITGEWNGSAHVIEIGSIGARYLNRVYRVFVNGENASGYIDFSVLSYAYANENPDYANVCGALYDYAQAAAAYKW